MKKVFADVNVRPMTAEEKQNVPEVKEPQGMTMYELFRERDSLGRAQDELAKSHLGLAEDAQARLDSIKKEIKRRYAKHDALRELKKHEELKRQKEYFMCTLSSLLGGEK